MTKLPGGMSAKQAAIAIVNETARIARPIMAHCGVYEAGHRPAEHQPETCATAG